MTSSAGSLTIAGPSIALTAECDSPRQFGLPSRLEPTRSKRWWRCPSMGTALWTCCSGWRPRDSTNDSYSRDRSQGWPKRSFQCLLGHRPSRPCHGPLSAAFELSAYSRAHCRCFDVELGSDFRSAPSSERQPAASDIQSQAGRR